MLVAAVVADEIAQNPEWNERGLTLTRVSDDIWSAFSRPPAGLLLDVRLGRLREETQCWRLQQLLHIPLIALAEDAASAEVVALLRRGADDVVSEPLNARSLAARVSAILRRSGPRDQSQPASGGPPVVYWGTTAVDLARRVVERPAGAAPLLRHEYDLLALLLRADGRVCAPAELAVALWGTIDSHAQRNLRTHIHHLRRKLEDDSSQPRYVVNVRGTGYRLVPPDAIRAFG